MKPMTACVSPSAPLLRPHRSLFSSRRAIRLALFLTEILLTSLSEALGDEGRDQPVAG